MLQLRLQGSYSGFPNIMKKKKRLINEYRAFCSCARSHREERLHISLWELSWAMSSFLRFAVEVNAVTERGAQYINDRFSKILTNIHSRTVRKIDSLTVKNSVTIQSLIMIGAQKKAFPYILHNGCVCVRSDALTNFLNAAMKRNDLMVKDVTAYLRNENLLKVDKSGKSTCKVNGIRMLCIPVNTLK